jgi:hypothetical protein
MNTAPPLPPLPPNVVNLPHVVKDPDPYQTQFVASLRDQFAMHALSMLANSDLKWEPQNPDWRVAASNTAYLIADQMMERRKQ